jgi:hypothetical protein
MKDSTYITCDGTRILALASTGAPSYGELIHTARPRTDNAVAALSVSGGENGGR